MSKKHWFQSYTGRQIDPWEIKSSDIDIRDIAHALSLTCRYTGHCPEHYSVAQHSCYVSDSLPDNFALWGLLHDAGEAYLMDLCRPTKVGLRERGVDIFDKLEKGIMDAVCARFNLLPRHEPPEVKKSDDLWLVTEARQFFGDTENYKNWEYRPENGWPIMENYTIKCWEPKHAEAQFLLRFASLYQRRPLHQ